jgi:tetratricopeptide (TPR) repeat protein
MWLAVAEARLRTGAAAEAVAAMEQAGRLAPGSAMVERGRAMFGRRMGETAQGLLDGRREKEAEGVLRAAVKAYPGEAELWRLLGLALYAQGRNGEAVGAFVQAIDRAPEEETLYAGLETLLPGGPEVERRLAGYAARHPGSALGWYLLGLERGMRRCLRRLGGWTGSSGRRRLRCTGAWRRGGRWRCSSGWWS